VGQEDLWRLRLPELVRNRVRGQSTFFVETIVPR
jgi:hypothetical protein